MIKNNVAVYALLFFLIISVTAVASDNSTVTKDQDRLILLQSSVLNAYFNGQYKEIKRAASFYGYGWLDDHRVFVAYQPEDSAEAFAKVEIIDINESRSFKLLDVGGAGESHFDINPKTKKIVFNDTEGIKLMIINIKDYSYSIKMLRKNVSGWGVFWINSQTIGYLDDDNLKKIILNK